MHRDSTPIDLDTERQARQRRVTDPADTAQQARHGRSARQEAHPAEVALFLRDVRGAYLTDLDLFLLRACLDSLQRQQRGDR